MVSNKILFLKFLAWMVPVFLVLTGTSLFVATDYIQHKNLDNLTARVGNHSGRIAAALGRHNGDTLNVVGNDLLGSLLADPAIACAELRQRGLSSPLLIAPRFVGCENQTKFKILTLPSGRGGRTLSVYFSTLEVEHAARTNHFSMLLILLAGLCVACVAGFFGFRQTVGKPLAQLLDAIKQSADTGEAVLAPVVKRDELGVVIDAYNQLQTGLRQARQTMQREVAQRVEEEQRAAHAERITAGLQAFQQDILGMTVQLHDHVGNITAVSGKLDEAAAGVTQAARALEKDGQKNAGQSADVAVAFEELAATISDMAAKVRETLEAGTAVRLSGSHVKERLADLSRSIESYAEKWVTE